ncbi:tol-pal system protein YbgF [Rhodobacteraceae bacterium (ex Bugula neritina AB1)]|nr:tol-pal system protein YbgF [Rhodobacteraceae bacterium (ex Bugula neritina AB1)]
MKRLRTVLFASVMLLPLPLAAQDSQTLADIRQELTVLHVEIQRLKRELSTTGTPSADVSGDTVLDRVAAIESELQRLTLQTEQMNHRIDRIVTDGTNRIGDLEFRLVELEGGDVAALEETTTLGGGDLPAVASPGGVSGTGDTSGGELAIGEQADFDAAEKLLADGVYQDAAEKFAAFNQAYPGSPLAPAAEFSRGKALDGLGDTREAARAYLAAFTGNSAGPVAPKALLELGAALGRLGQAKQACVTLAEVGVRFPGAAQKAEAAAEMTKLGCS